MVMGATRAARRGRTWTLGVSSLALTLATGLGLGACGDSGDDSTGTDPSTTGEQTTTTDPSAGPMTSSTSTTTMTGGTGTMGEETESGTPETVTSDATQPTEPDPICGDGNVDADNDEECDDGNDDNTDDCLDTCVLASCGDGEVQAGVEECDDGNDNNEDTCVEGCLNAGCGDGYLNPGEACDDGNDVNDDLCTNDCALTSCGDGQVQQGEECDDGNNVNTDACLDTCLNAVCGDAQVQEGVEGCDDGNDDDSDDCTTLCQAPACDDGILSGAESDVDCGGDTCDACQLDQACNADADCGQGSCVGGFCSLVANCAEILALDPASVSGIYKIDPDGDGGNEAFDVSCDMDSDGGGWTLVFHVYKMGGHPNGLRENQYTALFGHNRWTDESWVYDSMNNTISSGVGDGLVTLVDQGALDIDLFDGQWDDVRMTCALGNEVETPTNFAQVNGYATANNSSKLHGATANGTSYMTDPGLNSFDQDQIWHDNETTSGNSGHYLCDTWQGGSSGAQFGFCYTNHLQNPNNLDYGDSIVSLAFGTQYNQDSWSVGFTGECGDMGFTAQQNQGTYSIWIR